MARLTALQAEWLSARNRQRVREVTDRMVGALLIAFAVIEIWIFRRLKWL